MNKIFIIIPVHNRRSLTRTCLLGLSKQMYKNFETVIIDDGSTDGTSEMIKNEFPKVTLLKGDGTLYWSGGYNKCLEYVFKKANDGDYVLSLNDDVEFDENYLLRLFGAAEDNPNMLVMSAGYDKDNRDKLVMPGYNINPVTIRQRTAKNISPDTKYSSVNTICGRGLLMPLKIAKKVGFADERRFPMVGDHDLSLRCRKNKIKTVISYEAKIYTGPSYTSEHYFNNYSLKNFFNYVTDIRSTGNLKYRFWAIVKNRPLLLIPINLFFDINCITFGYFKRWSLKKINGRW